MPVAREIPWPRVFAEGAAIVVSILLAFSIEAWWSDRQVEESVQENLTALREELTENLNEIALELSFRHEVITSIKKLIAPEDNADTVSPAEVDKLLGDLMWVGRIQISTAALEGTLRSGIFSAIEDEELQRALAFLPAIYELVTQFQDAEIDTTGSRLYAYINANGSYNQIANTMTGGRPGVGNLVTDDQYRVNTPRDHTKLLESDEFLGLLTLAYGTHSDVVYGYGQFTSAMNNAIVEIDRHVQ